MTLSFAPYDKVREQFPSQALVEYEVPVEHYVSAPLPTLRWGAPGYAAFAAPAVRDPFGPMEADPPDRWWAVDAVRLRLLAYALTVSVPFTNRVLDDSVMVTPPGRPAGAAREDEKVIASLMDQAAGAFFASAEGDPGLRAELSATLGLVVPPECADWYRALTPDFFAWLEN